MKRAGIQRKEGRKERKSVRRKYTKRPKKYTHHRNIGLGSILEPGEELSRSVGHLLVRLSFVPERLVVSVVLVLDGVERDRGILLLKFAHASGSGGEEFVFGRWGRFGQRASRSGVNRNLTTFSERVPDVTAVNIARQRSVPLL